MNVITHKELTQDDVDLYWYYHKNGLKKGFFERYFLKLKTARTVNEAFHEVNQEFFMLFGEEKYSCIRSFRGSLKNYLNDQRK